MNIKSINSFIPSKDFKNSRDFYTNMGFIPKVISEDLILMTMGGHSFFLQQFYQKELAENLMLQMVVTDIQDTYQSLKKLQTNFDFKLSPIKSEPWGQVINLWGPSGELWHIVTFY